jgi:hypothetical protein
LTVRHFTRLLDSWNLGSITGPLFAVSLLVRQEGRPRIELPLGVKQGTE